MRHIYKASEWESTGHWYVNDIEGGGSAASKWWMPVRMLGITPNEYVLMLRDQFNAKRFHYTVEGNVLMFSFDSQAEARKYKNWINAQARKTQFFCG